MTLLEDIDRLRLHPKLEALVWDDMLEVFDEGEVASAFHDQDFFVENYIYREDRWPNKVTSKVVDLIDAHETGYAQTVRDS